MKKNQPRPILISIFLFILHLLLIGFSAYAQGPKTVAILPFKINAAQDLTYLQEGMADMLASRLAWRGEVEIVEKGLVKSKVAEKGVPDNADQALTLGRALQVDYVILGSLTVFGESVSIDAKILDVAQAEELMTAFNQSRGMDEVIPTIDQFAHDINEKIMGRVIRPRMQAAEDEDRRGFGVLLKGEETLGRGKPGHVQRFNVQIISLDVGDVDGDGKKEMVFVDLHSVFIYKWENNSFRLLRKIDGPRGASNFYVSLGDMNRNGRDEIYVSSLWGSTTASSVLEWNGNDFQKIADRESWLFRVVDLPRQGPVLVGQKITIDGMFQGKIQFLRREKDSYISTGSLALHHHATVFNFTLVDLAGSDAYTVMFGPFDYLWLVDPNQKDIWMSDDHFGGTYNFIHSPIYITDIDEDGTSEIMVCKNHSATRRLTESLRIFESGEVHFLTYDQAGLSTQYKTAKQSGAIVGYRLVDLENDGRKELLIAAVTKQDFTMRKPQSRVTVYNLQ